ncbi:hypothetical protein GQ457_06G029720 [Hibiscus cannabinus]
MNPAAYPADFPTGPGEQRNHNKKRRQDEDPPDSGGLPPSETTASPAQPPSYKDTLLGDRQHEIPKDDVFLDEEDIDLNEDDVIRGMDNDVIMIDFSERVHNLAVKSLDQTVVIKIIGRRIGYVTLRNKLHEVWKPDQAFKLMDIENDYFLVTFRSRVDYLHVLADGPWTVFGHYVFVEPWSEDFSTAQPYPSNIVAWIRLPGLPVTLYKRSLITELGECIGRVLKLDYQTETGRRGRFARMAIRVNLNKPLVSKIVVNGRTQLVEYESLPTICFHCGKYGHVTDNCPELIPKDSAGPEMPSASTSEPSTAMFGSWMVVERRQRRPQLKTSVGKTHSPGVVISESRFAPIIDDNANEAGTNDLSPSAPASSPLVFAETSNMKQPTFPKRRSLPKTIASKSNSRALKATNKTSPTAQHSATFNVRKPLQLTLADLPILHRTGHKAGSSNHPSSSKGTTCLDQNRHSSVSLPENSDPNIPLHVPSKLVSNSLVAPPKKPPDPNDIVSPTAHAQESTSVDAHNAEISFDAHSLDATSHVSFGSVLTANGDWDVAKLAQIFTDDALPYIIGVKPPSPQGGSDRCIWRWTNHHVFELKSAYDRCSPLILEETDPIWNQIWTLQVPQRIRCFLWLASRQKLMTNLHRCRRTLSDDPYCPFCQEAEESIIHTFRDCERLQQVWRYIIPSSLAASFFSNPIKVWLRQNLCSNILFRNSIPWKIVFAAILWQFWKCRNDVVFVGDSASVECALSRGIAWAQYYNDGWLHPMQTVHAPPRTIPWQNPKHGCLCLNVDGAVSLNTGKATIGGLLRDTAGNFIFGFSKYIGFTNSLHAELWALYVGLQLAWDHGVNFLQIQTDCNRVLELLHDTNVDSCPISLVRSIHQFWRRAWYVDLIWVPRSSNQAADSMARIANCSSFDLLFFSDPPAQLHDVLTTDALVLSL